MTKSNKNDNVEGIHPRKRKFNEIGLRKSGYISDTLIRQFLGVPCELDFQEKIVQRACYE